MSRASRGVGYCQNSHCEDFGKGVFLLNHGTTFSCPDCRQQGRVETERGFARGESKVFREVRVEYNYDPEQHAYRDVAIVQDISLWGDTSSYTLRSPLVRTEKRALKVAEAILANLNRAPDHLAPDEIPTAAETVLCLDSSREDFDRKLEQLAKEWEASGLCASRS
jgi:hypothetical protein